jgi:AGZA family xanthine/uracil permease-like MFS transporter
MAFKSRTRGTGNAAATTLARTFTSRIDGYFRITERGSTVARELRGGIVTFFTMAYIILLNPLIIGTQRDVTGHFLGGGETPDLAHVAAATSLVAGVLTILMGVFANFPMALAAGLGLNAFVTVAVASRMTWADAMGLVVIEGLLLLLLVLTGLRKAVFSAVPAELKVAISVGIGGFIALIGFVDGHFVSRSEQPLVPVELGIGGQLAGWPVLVFALGLIIMILLMVLRVKAAILIGIVVATVLAVIIEAIAKIGPATNAAGPVNSHGWALSVPVLPDRLVAVPNFSLIGHVDLFGGFQRVGPVAAVLFVFTLMLADFFDTVGTMTGIAAQAGLLDENCSPPNAQRILIVDSLAAAAGGIASVSSNTSYVESVAGVSEGARTGLAPLVTGLLFLLSTFFAPVVEIIPKEAAAPALVVVGFLMLTQVRVIDWNDYGIAVPAFLIATLMPFTYSITVGIGAGFVSHVLVRTAQGRARQVHLLMWTVAALFTIYFALNPLEQLMGVMGAADPPGRATLSLTGTGIHS